MKIAWTIIAVAGALCGVVVAACGTSPPRPAASVHSSTTARTPASARLRAAVSPTAPGAHRAPLESVPVLVYHLVNTAPPGVRFPEVWTPRAQFAAQVADLAARGYHAVTLQQVWDAWHHGALLPDRPLVFSFDDGYHSQFTNALPILRARGWPAVVNLQVSQLRRDLEPDQVRAMIAAGWEVDAHTFTHPPLPSLDGARLQREVAGSRREIRRRFGVPANFFCYPVGEYDATVVAAVRDAGFVGATTATPGLATPRQSPYELSRITLKGYDGVDGLRRRLAEASSGS